MTLTRRGVVTAGLWSGVAAALPGRLLANSPSSGDIVETNHGKVRGRRDGEITAFRGIPYGADTSGRRFLSALPPKPWTGVKDCSQFGHRAPQGSTGPGRIQPGANKDLIEAINVAFKTGQVGSGNESEDCLVLNVFTPDASSRTKRPVLFWLHGGGFAIGSAGEPVYEGGTLAARGDVVVVTINHRLYAPGYLYLGALHPDFALSGNVGQLDQILALQWVKQNIANFGGDPHNVTIFGESGGGQKVSALLAMPRAGGLFHKAIIQSGAGLRMIDKADAAAFAEQVVSVLGVAAPDVHRLQTMDLDVIMRAAIEAERQLGPGHRNLSPVVDGDALPANPFDPSAPDVSRNVPIIVGTNKDENTLFSVGDPKFGTMTLEDAHERFKATLHDKGEAAFEFYTQRMPHEAPTYLVTSMQTHSGAWINSIRLSERKRAQNAASVHMYRLDYETPILGGMMRTPHGLDTPMVFGHAKEFARLLGEGPEPQRVSEQMMDAWIAFARTGDPSTPKLPWPAYETADRQTMIFATESRHVADPDKAFREFWSV